MGRPSARTKWLVTIAAPLLALLALELGLRLAGFEQQAVVVPIVVWNEEQDTILDDRTALHQVDAWSLWAPRPGALVVAGTGERINAAGFRGPEAIDPRDPAVLRIVLLGESSTFGTTVPWEQTCAPQLRELLATRGVQAEVLNAGVIGFTVRQGLARYASAVRPLHPDVVVIAFGAQNEHAPCQGRCDREKLELARQHRDGGPSLWPALSRHVRVLQLANWMLMRREAPELLHRMDASFRERSEDPARIGQPDWPGCRRVPLDDFEVALRELCAAVIADGARPILCSLPRTPATEARLPILPLYSQIVARVGGELGVPIADLRAALLEALATGSEEQSFFIATDTWHLGPKGQGLFAQLLADALTTEPCPLSALSPLATLFVLTIGLVLPVLAWRGSRRLAAALDAADSAGASAGQPAPLTPRNYLVSAFSTQLLTLGFALLVAREVGLELPGPFRFEPLAWLATAVVFGVLLATLPARWRTRTPAQRRRQALTTPRTPGQRLANVALCLLAGVGEELTYRGVLHGCLWWATGSWWIASIAASLSFGVAHVIQGRRSMWIIAGVALWMHVIVLWTGSLHLAMGVHALYDLIATFTVAKWASPDALGRN